MEDFTTMDVKQHYLETTRFEFDRLKRLADKALDQLPVDEALHVELDGESNSIAVIMQHLGGNMVSRWTDFLTTDGEKPDRNRDGEFEPHRERSRDELVTIWERGWSTLFREYDALTPDDLDESVTIRGETLSVPQALQRQLTHAAYHIGQLVYLARHLSADSGWTSLSIPKGESHGVRGDYKNR